MAGQRGNFASREKSERGNLKKLRGISFHSNLSQNRGRLRYESESGFTVVELMITLLIIGILVGIVVMTMAVSRSKAQQAACKANLRTIFSAISQYQAIHGGDYPPNLDVLITENYLKSNFNWKCPSGPLDHQSYDYRDYYDPTTGQTSCPRANHNL